MLKFIKALFRPNRSQEWHRHETLLGGLVMRRWCINDRCYQYRPLTEQERFEFVQDTAL